MKKAIAVLLCAAVIVSVGIISLSAEELATKEEAAMVIEVAGGEAAATLPENEVLWIWGEVTAVDVLAKQLTVKYLDYETDAEKEISMNVNNQTAFENVSSLAEIKARDTVSMDYSVDLEGKNMARSISVEKNEGEVQQAPAAVATPGLE